MRRSAVNSTVTGARQGQRSPREAAPLSLARLDATIAESLQNVGWCAPTSSFPTENLAYNSAPLQAKESPRPQRRSPLQVRRQYFVHVLPLRSRCRRRLPGCHPSLISQQPSLPLSSPFRYHTDAAKEAAKMNQQVCLPQALSTAAPAPRFPSPSLPFRRIPLHNISPCSPC